MTYKRRYSRMFYKDKHILVWVRLMWESSSWYEYLQEAQKPLPQAHEAGVLRDLRAHPLWGSVYITGWYPVTTCAS